MNKIDIALLQLLEELKTEAKLAMPYASDEEDEMMVSVGASINYRINKIKNEESNDLPYGFKLKIDPSLKDGEYRLESSDPKYNYEILNAKHDVLTWTQGRSNEDIKIRTLEIELELDSYNDNAL